MQQQSHGLLYRIADILLAATCYLPIAWLVSFYSFVWRATIRLGHIPRSDGSDDLTLSQAHRNIIDFIFAATFFSPLIVLLLAIITYPTRKSRFKIVSLIIYGVTLAISFLLLRYDGLIVWYLD